MTSAAGGGLVLGAQRDRVHPGVRRRHHRVPPTWTGGAHRDWNAAEVATSDVRASLELVGTDAVENGVVIQTYRPAGPGADLG